MYRHFFCKFGPIRRWRRGGTIWNWNWNREHLKMEFPSLRTQSQMTLVNVWNFRSGRTGQAEPGRQAEQPRGAEESRTHESDWMRRYARKNNRTYVPRASRPRALSESLVCVRGPEPGLRETSEEYCGLDLSLPLTNTII